MFNKQRNICWLNVVEIYQMHSTRCIKITDAQQERISNNYKDVKQRYSNRMLQSGTNTSCIS